MLASDTGTERGRAYAHAGIDGRAGLAQVTGTRSVRRPGL